MIRAVLFDIDGVLLDSFEANLKFFQDFMTHIGNRPPTREEYEPLFHRPMRDVLTTLLPDKTTDEITQLWIMARQRVVPYPVELLSTPEDIDATLNILHSQYALGVVTSRTTEGVFGIPQLAALKAYFNVVVAYQDTAEHKPHPAPLLRAAEKLGMTPNNIVYVGDVENDIVAARAAGMKVITYAPQPVGAADGWTASFRELPNIIAAL